ncbi:sensor histidine kinase [Nocardia acidivorans]|uniref:sensor histidine kinase n=1 Tax=Nocardia acidivorans TaxID=404580 RepID=UPI001FDF98B2|nr:histidine kinase [Nocardia acidivorans]
MDVSRALARQSLLVAVVAAVVDSAQLVLCGAFGAAPLAASLLAAGFIAADLSLAAAPTTRSVVVTALAQVAVKFAAALFVHHHGGTTRVSDIGFLVAGYRAGAWLNGTASVATVLVLALGAGITNVAATESLSRNWRLLLVMVGAGFVPWLVGRYTTARGAYIAELEQRERLRRQEQRAALDRALSEERAAIARDLHDVISHHVSAIGIHAGVARIALSRTDAEAATRSLTAVESSSRSAMVDLRRQLDLLHGRDEDGQRQPGLADIDELIERVRAAGLEVRVEISGEPPVLPGSLDIMLYRVVQEILTNALRHGRDPARLEIGYRPTRVEIRETNPIATAPALDAGVRRGLDGIRRRVELFGGTIDSGPDRAGSHWEIMVSVPIGAA